MSRARWRGGGMIPPLFLASGDLAGLSLRAQQVLLSWGGSGPGWSQFELGRPLAPLCRTRRPGGRGWSFCGKCEPSAPCSVCSQPAAAWQRDGAVSFASPGLLFGGSEYSLLNCRRIGLGASAKVRVRGPTRWGMCRWLVCGIRGAAVLTTAMALASNARRPRGGPKGWDHPTPSPGRSCCRPDSDGARIERPAAAAGRLVSLG